MDRLWLNFDSTMSALSAVNWITACKIALQTVIIVYAAFWMWGRIRGTQAERLVKGVMLLACVYLLAWICDLKLITTILQSIIPVAVVSLVIIFQPEIRRGLGYLGRTKFRLDFSLTDTQKLRAGEVIAHIVSAVRELSREKSGALIVVEPQEGERDYLSPGTTINADVSTNLLLSIFQSKAPLHDGAVVIRAAKIVAAGVILPITDNPKLSYRYGTRHRAAIGLSEIYDGLCIVVSEETGAISAANRGMLVRYNTADDLVDPLSYFYDENPGKTKADSPFQSFLALFGTRGTEAVSALSRATAAPRKQNNQVSSQAPGSDFAPTDKTQRESENAKLGSEAPTAGFMADVADDDIRPQAAQEPV